MRRWGLPALIGLLLLVAVGAWGFKQHQDRTALEVFMNNRYQLSFYNLITRVQNMEVLLAKSMAVAGEPDDTLIFSEIWLQSEGARENLTQLPVSSQVTARTAKFLAQAGDYARIKAAKINRGESLTAEEYDTLNTLYRQAEQLNRELHNMEISVSQGRLSVADITRGAREDLAKGDPTNRPQDFQSIDRDMQGFPTLIYDGPFSDHLDRAQAVGLKGNNVDNDDARRILREFVDQRDNTNYRAQVTGRSRERIPGFLVEMLPQQQGADGRITANVSEKGGHVVWYLNSRNIGTPRISVDQAREKASRFLEARGYENMFNIYFQQQDNRAIFNFIPRQNEVVIYPDQIKINVALDNGQVVGFDARGYLMAHKERELPEPAITVEEAIAKVNKRMEVTNTRLAVIPTDSGQERFSYEIAGSLNGEQFLVYVNAITGKTDQVLKLIETPVGTLTM